jgi:hypothetical protein
MSTLKVTNLQKLDGSTFPVGKVGQVFSTTKSDTATVSSSTFADVSGLSLTITPSATTSKVLITCNITLNHASQNNTAVFRFMRDSTPVGIGDASGSRLQASAATATVGGGDHPQTITAHFLDTPSTTSAVTYKIQIAGESGGSVTVNMRNQNQASNADPRYSRYASTITGMEVLA